MRTISLLVGCLGLSMVLVAQTTKKLNVVAGGLQSALTLTELNTITDLSLAGTIDARDFKTLRDNLPKLSMLDLEQVSIVAYSGEGGTDLELLSAGYFAGTIPQNALRFKEGLTKLILPKTASAIEKCAFEGCLDLNSITFPIALIQIGKRAFENCPALVLDEIPVSVSSIGASAFEDCRSLVSVSLPSQITEIEDGTFENCINLESVIIPDKITRIGANAFEDCRKLKHIVLPSSVKRIGEYAFENCRNLTGIDLPGTLISIGRCAFKDCRKLSSVILPESLSFLPDRLFEDCYSLTTLTIPSSVWSFGKEVFAGCNQLAAINIPSSVSELSDESFSQSSALLNVDQTNVCYSSVNGVLFNKNRTRLIAVPNSFSGSFAIPVPVDTIGKAAFIGCESLSSILIPASVSQIKGTPFDQCSGLITVDEANTRYSSEDGVLFNKDKDTLFVCPDSKSGDYSIPSSVKVIFKNAFKGCKKLNTVSIPASVSIIGNDAFSGSSTWISVSPENLNYTSDNGVLLDMARKTLIHCSVNTAGHYSVPGSVEYIARGAFENCLNMTSVTLPPKVKIIGKSAFENCTGLETVNLPTTVDSIEARAFEDCKKLTTLVLPASINSIGSNVFQGCSGLTSITAKRREPVLLDDVIDVFYEVSKDNCKIYVETGSKRSYQLARQWKNFRIVAQETDLTPPTSKVLSLPAITNAETVLVKWEGTDPESSVITYTIYVSVNGGPYSKWITTTDTQATFTGSYNNTYSFYSMATDASNNVEASKIQAEATTKMEKPANPDVNAPTSKVLSLPAITNAETILVKWEGTDPESSVITYTIYVSVNGGPYDKWITTTDTQATFTGSYNNTYSFYSIATDTSNNVEALKTQAEATTKMEKAVLVPIAVISQKWNDVLICHNTENKFIGYQWYKNGVAIAGETKQFYQELGGVNGIYYVQVTTSNGTIGISNVLEAGSSAKSVKVYPNPLEESNTCTVEIKAEENDLTGANMIVTNVNGQVISRRNGLQQQMKLEVLIRGVYIINVEFANGESFNGKIIVK